MTEIPGFEAAVFAHKGMEHVVYQRGEGPAVVLMHELPGMVPECIELAERIAERGFSVYMPLFFGKPGQFSMVGSTLRLCISREFYLFAKRKESPIAAWLRALCREAHASSGGPGVGVIGMCLTGGFALALLAEPAVIAPIMSQPSVPVGLRRGTQRELGVSDAQLAAVKARVEDEDIPLLGLRFTCDRLCQEPRFARLTELFGERFRKIEIDSSKGNPHGLSRMSHSVLTVDYDPTPGSPTVEARAAVMAFLEERLHRTA